MKGFWKVKDVKKSDLSSLPFKKLFFIALGINIASLGVALVAQVFLPPQVPLYYGQAETEKVIASSLALVLPALVSLTFLGINFLIGLTIKDEFLKKVLVISSFAASLFATTTIIKIVFLVGSF